MEIDAIFASDLSADEKNAKVLEIEKEIAML